MKDYARILESSKRASLQKIIPLKADKENLSQWKAIQLIEEMAERLRERLAGITPREVEEKVTSVKLQLYKKPDRGLPLFLKGQFYGVDKKRLLLKVFVHQVNGQGNSMKIARAVYHIELEKARHIA